MPTAARSAVCWEKPAASRASAPTPVSQPPSEAPKSPPALSSANMEAPASGIFRDATTSVPGHSPAFWEQVARRLPDWKARRALLRDE